MCKEMENFRRKIDTIWPPLFMIKKSAVDFIEGPFYVVSYFSLAAFKIPSLTLAFTVYDMPS